MRSIQMNNIFRLASNAELSFLRITIDATTRLLLMFICFNANALPMGGQLSSGNAVISNNSNSMIINQSTSNTVINWQSFSIGRNEAVQFVQPNSNSIALNRVTGSDPSTILGNLSSNGKIFLVNPNGILFGKDAQVNVGGLIASTLNISDRDFNAGNYKFSGTSNHTILNQGAIATNSDGSYVALFGSNVNNTGTIVARLGTVALASGSDITLDLVGDSLLNVTVNQGAVNALINNGGLLQADGGLVLLTTQAAGSLLQTVVNNTGVIQAQTIDNHTGTIKLLADMQSGTVNVGGTLSAQGGANSGDGGFVETSGSHVVIADSASINTLAANGKTGLWLLDPVNYSIGVDESAASVVASLATSDRLISATYNISVNEAILLASVQTLTLNAGHDVLINAPISGGTAANGLVLIAGNNVNVAAQLSVGAAASSIKISAGNDVNITAPVGAPGAAYLITISAGHDVNASAAIGVVGAASAIAITAGNDVTINNPVSAAAAASTINIKAGRNVNVLSAITTAAAASSISLIAGLNGTGPGAPSGTVVINPLASISSLNTTIRFNPVSYTTTAAEIAAYSTKVTGVLNAKAWVFTHGNNKVYDGTTLATLAFAGNPSPGGNLTLNSGLANFDTQNVGTGKKINFSGFSMSGIDSNIFALFATSGTTSANITPAALTITASNASKPYGQTITLTGFSVSGLQSGETIAQVNESSPGTLATASQSVAGTPYLITPSLAKGGTFNPSNYNIAYVDGLLLVTPVTPAISKSIAAVPEQSIAATPTEVQSQQQDELISITPVKISPVDLPLTSPNI
jgi:filamentous hemagglutinin family protein